MVQLKLSATPTTAAAAANEFLRLSRSEPGYPPCDHMKLQKLLFYAHAWHLALRDQPLFDEDVEAWPWGPVVPSIYNEFRDFGRRPIDRDAMELRRLEHGAYSLARASVEDAETKGFLRAVWDAHKKFTGIQLSKATHAPGEPWTVIKEQYGTLERKPIIPNQLIAEVFKKKINGASADTRASREHPQHA